MATVSDVKKVPDAMAESAVSTMRAFADKAQEGASATAKVVEQAQAPIAESAYEHGRKLVETTVKVTDLFREAADRSSGDTQALMASYANLGRGMQQVQHAWFDMVSRSFERMGEKRQALMRCTSPVEVAAVQRDIYLDAIDTLFTCNTTLLQLSGRIASEAVHPLQERARSAGRAQ